MPRDILHPEDLAACRAILRAGSKSFAAASLLLPKRVRTSATVLYSFCRVADDLIDLNPDASSATVDTLEGRLDRLYSGRPDDHPIDRALSVVVDRDRVPITLLRALLEGLAWDAKGRRYETLNDLYAYAARVAGTVGAMMTVVMGPRDPDVLARACDLGVAMQLTNIARDIGEDARRGRIYLPLDWLREGQMDVDSWLSKPEPTAHVRSMTARLLAEADVLYRRSDAGISRLPRNCRVSIRAARRIYSDIGRVIERNGFDSVSQRAFVSQWRKVWLVLRAFASRRERGSLEGPPLEPTRFLVDACQASG
jgi:15-cis-phytoene synthase